MVILHVASIYDDPCNGTSVVVPQHVRSQQQFETAGLLNTNGYRVPNLDHSFNGTFEITALPAPFSSPDLIVVHSCYDFGKNILKLQEGIRKAGCPYIIIPHGELQNTAQKKKHAKKILANFFIFNHFINHALAIQCLSADELKNTKFGKRKFIGTNGVAVPEKRKGSFNNKVKFVYIGRLEAFHKGLDLMVDAVKEKADFFRNNHWSVDLYGPDIKGRGDYLRGLIETASVTDIMTLHGPVSGEEKIKILLDSDVFIQTSRNEGMPLGILEALSYGVPCLVTRGTMLGDVIEKNRCGWVADTDAYSISELFETVKNGTWEEISKNAVETVRETFQWDVISKKTISRYKELLNENGW